MSWAEEEFRGIDLGDRRRGRRAMRLVERLAERPTASIPGACSGWAETQAAYRLLSGEDYDWMDLLEPHRQCTRARMVPHPRWCRACWTPPSWTSPARRSPGLAP